MHEQPLRARPLQSPWPDRFHPALAIPSWLLSLAFHVFVLLFLIVWVPRGPAGQDELAGRQVGIVLKRQSQEGEVYEGPALEQPDDPSEPSADLAESLQEAPVDLTSVLPEQDLQVVGPGPRRDLPQVEGRPSGRRLPAAPAAATRSGVPFFGIKDPARQVVYVVDRSASMGSDRNRLGRAKVELLASIETLDQTQQFQVIFYNQQVFAGPQVDQTGRMPFADEVSKTLASQFIRGVFSDGSTNHKRAILHALRLGPDAIFFLTDADEPRLRPADLESVTRANGGRTRIHAIEFGVGPDLGDDNFLKELARRNEGSYRYVDVSRR